MEELEQALITAIDTYKDWEEEAKDAGARLDVNYYQVMIDVTKSVLQYIRKERRTIHND